MRKDRILERDHKDYVRAERDVLTAVVHPYIVTLRYSFQASLAVCACMRRSAGARCCPAQPAAARDGTCGTLPIGALQTGVSCQSMGEGRNL